MRPARWLGVMAASLAAVPLGLARSPEQAVRDYLEAGAREDQEALRRHVVPPCWEEPEGRASPVRLLGAPMELSEVEVTSLTLEGDHATVRYEVAGSVRAEQTRSTLDAFGIQAEIQVEGLTVEQVRRMGTLDMVREDGRWQVTCAAARETPTALRPAPGIPPPPAPTTSAPPGG